MNRIAKIGSLLKKIYRKYSQDLLMLLQENGFIDLRPSFLEILSYVCEVDSPSIKEIGIACGLKKQTMTSHLNELEKRGYIVRTTSPRDKREQLVSLTENGEKFKIALLTCIETLDQRYTQDIGDVELERVLHSLDNLSVKIENSRNAQQSLL